MMKVYDKIKVRYGGRCVELMALFDTGAGGSYLSDEVAKKIGYKPYPEPRRIPLAVKGHEAEVIGYVPEAELEIAGHVLPELESLGVIRGLYVEAIIGRNLIEKYGITLEEGQIGFREVPPRASLLMVDVRYDFEFSHPMAAVDSGRSRRSRRPLCRPGRSLCLSGARLSRTARAPQWGPDEDLMGRTAGA